MVIHYRFFKISNVIDVLKVRITYFLKFLSKSSPPLSFQVFLKTSMTRLKIKNCCFFFFPQDSDEKSGRSLFFTVKGKNKKELPSTHIVIITLHNY